MPVREAGQFVKTPSVVPEKDCFCARLRDPERCGFPLHIQSTVDTRIVGRAELEINFSNFTREDSAEEEAPVDGSSDSNSPATPVQHLQAPQPVGALQEIDDPRNGRRARVIRRSVSIAEENAVPESTFV